MPTNDREEVNIKDLPIAVELSNSDTVLLIQNGAYTRRVDLGDIVAYTIASPQTELSTNHKEVIPAINELKEDVDILKTRGSGLNQIQMNLQFADISEGGN